MEIINMQQSQQIFKLESYWHGFSIALNMFRSTSGKQLQQGHGETMAIYRTGLNLYNEGLNHINTLKNAKTIESVNNIINISDILIANAKRFEEKLIG